MTYRIERCVCFDQPFTRLVAIARREGVTDLAGLRCHVAFGEKCGLCRPYVARALETGQTTFDELIDPA